jgi:hypothetical protein
VRDGGVYTAAKLEDRVRTLLRASGMADPLAGRPKGEVLADELGAMNRRGRQAFRSERRRGATVEAAVVVARRAATRR